jgi:hypothetical protein
VIAVLGAIGIVLTAVLAVPGTTFTLLTVITLLLYAVMAGAAWLTSRGVEGRKNWAKWLGIALGILELLNFPIGTVIGIALLVYLNRAIKSGVFAPQSTIAA